MDQRTFVKDAKAQLREWNADLAEMRARLELSDGPPNSDLEDHIDVFLSYRQLAEATLNRIAKVGPNGWSEKGPVLEMSWKALEQRVDDCLGTLR